MRKIIYTASLALLGTVAQAQVKVGANPATINAGSALEIEATDKGLLMPRISLSTTTTWGLAGTAAAGMSVYNTNAGLTATNTTYPAMGVGEYYWDGTGWVSKKSGVQLGADNGLTVGYNSAGNVGLGGTLAKNTEVAQGGFNLNFTGNTATDLVGIGTAAPNHKLTVVAPSQTVIASFDNGGHYSYARGIAIRNENNGAFFGYGSVDGNYGPKIVAGSNKQIGFFTEATTGAGLSLEPENPVNVMRMVIMGASGNVGIGTNLPSAKLEVNSGTTAGAIKLVDGTQGAGKLLTSDANGVGTWQMAADLGIPRPALFQLSSNISNFLNGVSAGNSQSTPMTQIVNKTDGSVTFNAGTNTISFSPGTYQMTFVYEATHDNTGCTLSSYIVDFPVGTGTTYKRIHSTAAHNQGGTSNHGGTISFTTTIGSAGYSWPIELGRGQSGNCSGTGNTLLAGSTQLSILKVSN